MNPLPCSVVRDLLVLYDDDVCSSESKTLIEEHIASCEKCRRLHEQMKTSIPPVAQTDEEQDLFIRTFKKAAKKITLRHMIVSWILIICLILGYTVWDQHLQYLVNRIPTEDITVSELYELENGDIFCTLKCQNAVYHYTTGEIIVPDGFGRKDYNGGSYELFMQYELPMDKKDERLSFGTTLSFVFPKEYTDSVCSVWTADKNGEMQPEQPYTHTAASISYIGKGTGDRLLIWEKGQKIAKAPETVEALVRQEREANFEFYGNKLALTPYQVDRRNLKETTE